MANKPGNSQSGASYYGTDIIALLELDPNETYVPIRRLCERLGISAAPQERRVKAHSLLRAGSRTLRLEAENGYETALGLRVDLLPLWLVGVDAGHVEPEAQGRLETLQRECASLLWQSFKPQGFGAEDELLPLRHEQNQSEQAYVTAQGMATLARQQMLIERQLNAARTDGNSRDQRSTPLDDREATLLAQTARRVAMTLSERTRRNEYGGVYSGLYRQFGITSYRRMPPARLREALEWLERWHGDILGEPEPPPDI